VNPHTLNRHSIAALNGEIVRRGRITLLNENNKTDIVSTIEWQVQHKNALTEADVNSLVANQLNDNKQKLNGRFPFFGHRTNQCS
jgi:hypothetical protein